MPREIFRVLLVSRLYMWLRMGQLPKAAGLSSFLYLYPRVELRVAGSVSFVISLRPSVVEDPLGAGAMHDFAAVMKAICTGLARPQTKIVLFSNGLQVLLCMIDVHGQ